MSNGSGYRQIIEIYFAVFRDTRHISEKDNGYYGSDVVTKWVSLIQQLIWTSRESDAKLEKNKFFPARKESTCAFEQFPIL